MSRADLGAVILLVGMVALAAAMSIAAARWHGGNAPILGCSACRGGV